MFSKRLERLKNQDGISMLEVLIAMIILSMALLVLLNMAMVALDGNHWSNRTTVATQMLQQKLEQMRSDAAGGLESGIDTVDNIIRTWTVVNAGSHLRQVTVDAVWLDIRQDKRSNAVSALIRTPYI